MITSRLLRCALLVAAVLLLTTAALATTFSSAQRYCPVCGEIVEVQLPMSTNDVGGQDRDLLQRAGGAQIFMEVVASCGICGFTGWPADFSEEKPRRRGKDPSGGAAAVALMASFFQSNRMTPAPAGNKASALQAMLMMKSSIVNDRVLAEGDGRVQHLVESGLSDAEVVEELYLATLARWPTEAEQEVALAALGQERRSGAENLQWALLNGPEFLVNH